MNTSSNYIADCLSIIAEMRANRNANNTSGFAGVTCSIEWDIEKPFHAQRRFVNVETVGEQNEINHNKVNFAAVFGYKFAHSNVLKAAWDCAESIYAERNGEDMNEFEPSGSYPDELFGVEVPQGTKSEELAEIHKQEMESKQQIQKEESQRQQNLSMAKEMASRYKAEIMNQVLAEGLDKAEVMEDFNDILSDTAFRHADCLEDKDLFIDAFLSEC